MSYSVDGVAGAISGHDQEDVDGNPAGGEATGIGFELNWQDGPVDRDAGELPTGAFIEDVVMACIMRMRFYQGEPYVDSQPHNSGNGRFACYENKQALRSLLAAHEWMMERRKDRAERGILGKHEA